MVLQELSRRYVSKRNLEFNFLVTEDLAPIILKDITIVDNVTGATICGVMVKDIIDLCLKFYDEASANGVQAQSARRILPQAMYTKTWHSGLPMNWANYFKLRTDSHAQTEIRILSSNMLEMFEKNNYVMISI
jgi:thymidylate synthase ThyX